MENTAESLAAEYMRGLTQQYRYKSGEGADGMKSAEALEAEEALQALEAVWGASEEDVRHLQAVWPQCPESLIALLRLVDGTYWRVYGETNVSVFMFGSNLSGEPDDGWSPYYLLSSAQIAGKGAAFDESIEDIWNGADVEVDRRIRSDVNMSRWLHFADCMNNGGTSQLFIDFAPAPNGQAGQIVRFVHDPDSFIVVADSFDDFLQNMMQARYPFIE